MVKEILTPIEVLAGVESASDNTALATPHYVEADKIRFVNNKPEKIGGWQEYITDDPNNIVGLARSFFSYQLQDSTRSIIGTHKRVYVLSGGGLLNITPFDSSEIAIANGIDNIYFALGNNPIETTLNSNRVKTLLPTGHKITIGDTIQIANAVGFNNISTNDLNNIFFVRESSANSVSFDVSSVANASGQGGGNSITLGTQILIVNKIAHGLSHGDRIKIVNATDIGGIFASNINVEHIISNVASDSFEVRVGATFSTSLVIGGGGADAEYKPPLPQGNINASIGQGYGLGRYGLGRYGVPKISTSVQKRPRIWHFDKFGNNILSTAGLGSPVYIYLNDNIAPTILPNAPTEVNYVFVDNNIVVCLGADGVMNRIKWSDQGDASNWTPTFANQAGQDDIEGADRFISHANTKGINLLFTSRQVYTFRYVGGNFVWETRLLDADNGIISQNARIVVEGTCYWMGKDNFLYYKGGSVEILPSNSRAESTIKKLVFKNLNYAQAPKIFCWHNQKFNEIWWHYPSGTSLENDTIARFNYKELTWVSDTMDRSAAEYPVGLLGFHRAINSQGIIYNHEDGYNDNTSPLPFSLKTKFIQFDNNVIDVKQIIPDNILSEGNITLQIATKDYPQSTNVSATDYPITATTEVVESYNNGRILQLSFSGNTLNQNWKMGAWNALIQKAGK